MEKSGVVIELRGNRALVEVRRTGSCGDKCSTCSSACEAPAAKIEVLNDRGVKIGDYVTLVVSESDMLKAGFALYTVPLIAMVIGIAIGMMVAPLLGISASDLFGLGVGIVLMFGAFVLINRTKHAKKEIVTIKSVGSSLNTW